MSDQIKDMELNDEGEWFIVGGDEDIKTFDRRSILILGPEDGLPTHAVVLNKPLIMESKSCKSSPPESNTAKTDE